MHQRVIARMGDRKGGVNGRGVNGYGESSHMLMFGSGVAIGRAWSNESAVGALAARESGDQNEGGT